MDLQPRWTLPPAAPSDSACLPGRNRVIYLLMAVRWLTAATAVMVLSGLGCTLARFQAPAITAAPQDVRWGERAERLNVLTACQPHEVKLCIDAAEAAAAAKAAKGKDK